MNRIGNKRINDDNFEQFEVCLDCKKGFWATSRWELGNWAVRCNPCQKKRDEEYKKKYAKEYAKEIKEVEDFENSLTDGARNLITKIDDMIRDKRKSGVKKMVWSADEFDALRAFNLFNGFGLPSKKGFRFMGVDHYQC